MADSMADERNRYSLNSEKQRLLDGKKNKRKGRLLFYYRLKWLVGNKCAILVLIMVTLVHTFDPYMMAAQYFRSYEKTLFAIYSGCSLFFFLFYPITGLYADIKFGRFKTAIAALLVSSCTTILMIVGIFLLWYKSIGLIGLVLFSIGYILGNFAHTAFYIVILSFGVDQLQGASGEELSAFVCWFYFCRVAGWVISVPVSCLTKLIKDDYIFVADCAAHICCITVCLVIMMSFRKSVIAEPQFRANPISTIVKVLKYAKNNKFPRNRSALTYWENDYPSRLDLGKEKYGGPFTEEQVQDVKTLLKIIPLIVCMLVFFIQAEGYSFIFQPIKNAYAYCLLSSEFVSLVIIISTILFHQTVLYPLLYKFYPSMLKRIGIGIFLCFLAEVVWLVIGSVTPSETDGCILNDLLEYRNNATSAFIWDISTYWILIPNIISGLGFGTVAPTTLEFAFAQAPYSMRGVVVGLWFMATGFLKAIGFCFLYPFLRIEHSCELYLFVTKVVVIALSLVCFVCLSYSYKLRFRGDRFDQHQTVENFYSKYLEADDDDNDSAIVDADFASFTERETITNGRLQDLTY